MSALYICSSFSFFPFFTWYLFILPTKYTKQACLRLYYCIRNNQGMSAPLVPHLRDAELGPLRGQKHMRLVKKTLHVRYKRASDPTVSGYRTRTIRMVEMTPTPKLCVRAFEVSLPRCSLATECPPKNNILPQILEFLSSTTVTRF